MELVHTLLILLPFLHGSISQQWCTPPSAVVTKDGVAPTQTGIYDHFYIGGLFDVSQQTAQGQCGKVTMEGLQQSEAFIWAVKTFKSRYPSAINNIDIGGLVFDTCSSSEKALQLMLNFEQCAVGYGVSAKSVTPKTTFAYVGPSSYFELPPVISYFKKVQKTAMGISPGSKGFPYSNNFINTVPNAKKEAEAVMSIVNRMATEDRKWKVFRIVYAANKFDYSQNKVYEEFKKLSSPYCFERNADEDIEFENDADATAVKVANLLKAKVSVRGVVLFLSSSQISALMKVVTQMSLNDAFTWIASTGWTNDGKTASSYETSSTLGAVVLSYPPPTQAYRAFETAFKAQTLKSSSTTGVKKYYQQERLCDPPGLKAEHNKGCNLTEKIFRAASISPYTYFTIQAVDAALFGIEAARKKKCTTSNILCSSFLNSATIQSDINQGIQEVSNSHIKFMKSDNSAYYTRFEYLNKIRPSASCKSNCFDKVGIYFQNGKDKAVASWSKNINYFFGGGSTTTSTCIVSGCSCKVTVTTPPTKPTKPTVAVATTVNGSAAEPEAELFGAAKIRTEVWVIPLIVLACVGILLVIIFEIFFVAKIITLRQLKKFRTMWSGQILLLGVLLSYLLCFAFVVVPNEAVCGIIRFGVGVCYAIMFSVLLVKILIILSSETVGYLKGIFQFLMFVFALAVQIAINSEWLILIAPEVENGICNHTFDQTWKSLCYLMLLIILITILAIRSHGIVTNHREGIFIGLAAGFSIPIWIAWGLIGSLNSYDFKEPSVVFGLLINATLILFTMFMPKVRQLTAAGLEAIYLEDDDEKEVYGSVMYGPSMYGEGAIPAIYDNNTLPYAPRSEYIRSEYTAKQLEHLDTMRIHRPGPYSVRSVPVHTGTMRTLSPELKGQNYKYAQSEYATFDRLAVKRGGPRSELGAL